MFIGEKCLDCHQEHGLQLACTGKTLCRAGVSLLELIVALGIVSLLLLLLLTAINSARSAAATAKVKNQLRQLGIAVATVESEREKLPVAGNVFTTDGDLADALLPKLGHIGRYYAVPPAHVPAFANSLDPSYDAFPDNWEGNSSFAFNYLVFETQSKARNLSDGRSGTMMSSERYARCRDSKLRSELGVDSSLHGGNSATRDNHGNILPTRVTPRSITFVNRFTDDVLPQYDPQTRTSSGAIPGLTFQLAPRPDACDPRVLQASTTSGLVVGLMDGSVRTLSPGIDPAVYWSTMTPDKGETVFLE